MRQRVAVRGVLGSEVVTLHSTLKTFTLGLPAHIDDLAGLEAVDFDLAADFDTLEIRFFSAELPQTTTGLHSRLGEMASNGLINA